MMALIQSAEDLKEYCLRRLGKPVISIAIDDTQANDRIDDALQMFIKRHYDGVTEVYQKYTVTQSDVDRGYLNIPTDIVAITDIIDPNSSGQGSAEEFERLRFRLKESEIFDFTNPDLLSYTLTMQHITMMLDMWTPKRQFQFNSTSHRMTISGNLRAGDFIILHAYKAINPDTSVDVYNDEWVKKYATALLKKQWGSNTKKFEGVQLPGGITMNGQQIYDEANEEVIRLEEEFSLKYELPVDFFIG